MFRIDSAGATVGNLFTEGNPSLGVPATVVSAEWLNDTVQEELVGVVLAAGLTLDKGDNTQLLQALNILIGGGGSTQINQTIDNNEGTPQDVTGLLFDAGSFKAGKFEFDIFRRTDSGNEKETGTAYVSYNTETSAWDISLTSVFDDAGVTLSITAGGQVQYTSDDLAGASYAGNMRVAAIIKFNN